jgi:hypothetical protein
MPGSRDRRQRTHSALPPDLLPRLLSPEPDTPQPTLPQPLSRYDRHAASFKIAQIRLVSVPAHDIRRIARDVYRVNEVLRRPASSSRPRAESSSPRTASVSGHDVFRIRRSGGDTDSGGVTARRVPSELLSSDREFATDMFPALGAVGLAWALGAYAAASGMVLVALAIRPRPRPVMAGFRSREPTSAGAACGPPHTYGPAFRLHERYGGPADALRAKAGPPARSPSTIATRLLTSIAPRV